MLKKLLIKNLAIIDELEIKFNSSFNVITGESGSGKTIIYRSIKYLFGDIFNKDDIRKNQSHSEITGFIDIENKTYKLSRIFSTKSTKNLINGKNVKRSEYIDFINNLWESYGQHEQQLLLDESKHIIYLDIFANTLKKLHGAYKDTQLQYYHPE